MFDWFKKTIVPEITVDVKPILRLSNQELTDIFNNQQVCPDCGVWDFREGPSGGMSTNIYCANCGSWFNEQGPFGLDRIFKEDNYDWRDLPEFASDNFVYYTWDILRDWHQVTIGSTKSKDRQGLLFMVAHWCDNNIGGKWSVKDYILYFEEESDAVAAKLVG